MIRENINKIFTKILPCLFTFGILIYFCIKDNNFLILVNIFPKLKKTYLLLSIFSIISYWIFNALSIKKLRPNFFNSFYGYFKLTMYGIFYGSITPFSSGAQTSQVLLLKNNGISLGESISVLSQKLFLSQICTVIISSLSILFKRNKFEDKILGFGFITSIGLIIQCFGILSIVLFYINKRKVMNLIHFILKLVEKIKLIKDSKELGNKIEHHLSYLMENNFSINNKFTVLGYSFLESISFYMVSFFISKSFGLSGFPLTDMIAAQAFIVLLSIANPLPGSAGTSEGSFIILNKQFFNEKDIFPSMILFRLINYYLGLIVGLIVISLNEKFNRNKLLNR